MCFFGHGASVVVQENVAGFFIDDRGAHIAYPAFFIDDRLKRLPTLAVVFRAAQDNCLIRTTVAGRADSPVAERQDRAIFGCYERGNTKILDYSPPLLATRAVLRTKNRREMIFT